MLHVTYCTVTNIVSRISIALMSSSCLTVFFTISLDCTLLFSLIENESKEVVFKCS